MLRDIRKNKTFKNRVLALAAIQLFLAAILISRLAYLQLIKHSEYSVKADSNRIKPSINPAPRGIIFDRKGTALTTNNDNYRLTLYIKNKEIANATIDKVSKILGISDDQTAELFKKIERSSNRSTISLIDSLKWDDLARIETNYHLLPGISIDKGIIRHYLYPEDISHLVGYVSLPSEQEAKESNQGLFMHPDFRIGKTGLEYSFDESLRGQYGIEYIEVNANESPVHTLSVKSSQQGENIHTTIDLELQKFVTKRIADEIASVVVMNVKTGEILAYSSSPSFDPNQFVEGVSREYWNQLINHPSKPLNNKPITALYPPGSTFKMMVAIAALEEGINPKEKVYCPGYYQLGRRKFKCWKDHGHGHVNMEEAIGQSCNTYFFSMANRIGHESFINVARRFGYGIQPRISLPNARSGILPSKHWKEKAIHEPWVGGDTLNSSIGQGYLLASPLQMAIIASRIANGGVPIEPYLIKNEKSQTQFEELKNERLAQEEHLNIVKKGMYYVVNNKKGTSYWSRIQDSDFEMSGKTGTSQVISRKKNQQTVTKSDLTENHAIFVGFAPSDNPQYAISVVVDHGKSGSGAAAPIAKDVMTKVKELLVINED